MASPYLFSSNDRMRQPDCFFIGHQKAASTFLRDYFTNHPQICWDRSAAAHCGYPVPHPVDPPNRQGRDSTSVYITMFQGLCHSLFHYSGATPWTYIAFDKMSWQQLSEKTDLDPYATALRIKKRFPSAKILLVIRRQVDWIRSNYMHHILWLKHGKRSFQDFCATGEGLTVLHAAFYDLTIKAYLDVFFRDNVKILIFEMLKMDMERFLNELCQFLTVDSWSFDERIVNEGRSFAEINILKHLPKYIGKQIPEKIVATGRRVLRKLSTSGDPITKNERCLIQRVYATSNLRTSEMLGIDLSKYGY